MAALKNKKEKQINLLPKEKINETTLGRSLNWFLNTFRIMVIVVELCVVSAFLSRFWLDAKNTDLSEEMRQKEAQIKAMKPTEDKMRELQAKVQAINQILSANQLTPSQLISEVAQKTPPGTVLYSITITKEDVNLTGFSTDEIKINQFLTNLKSSENFKKAFLTTIGTDEENQALKFSIKIPMSL